jgi:hypothetical protein
MAANNVIFKEPHQVNRPGSKRSEKPNKVIKNSIFDIYGNSLQNTKDVTQNIKMINEKIRNESMSLSKTSVNLSQEDLKKETNNLSNSMHLLNTVGAT